MYCRTAANFLSFTMDYFKLIAGIAFFATFMWAFVRNLKRTSLVNALLSIDMLLGMAAGLYLTVTSVIALIS